MSKYTLHQLNIQRKTSYVDKNVQILSNKIPLGIFNLPEMKKVYGEKMPKRLRTFISENSGKSVIELTQDKSFINYIFGIDSGHTYRETVKQYYSAEIETVILNRIHNLIEVLKEFYIKIISDENLAYKVIKLTQARLFSSECFTRNLAITEFDYNYAFQRNGDADHSGNYYTKFHKFIIVQIQNKIELLNKMQAEQEKFLNLFINSS